MPRRIRPIDHYTGHQGYPSQHRAEEHPQSGRALDERQPHEPPPTERGRTPNGMGRRAFMGSLIAGASLLSSMETLGSTEKKKKKKKKTYKVTVVPLSRYLFRPCRYRVEHLVVETRNRRFAKFLSASKHRKAINSALQKVFRAHDCDDVTNAKKLARMERSLASALQSVYKKETKRRTRRPTVTLYLKKHRPMPLPGFVAPPSRPRPRPRPRP